MHTSVRIVFFFAGCALQQVDLCNAKADQHCLQTRCTHSTPSFGLSEPLLDSRFPICYASDFVFKPTSKNISSPQPGTRISLPRVGSFVEHQCFENMIKGQEKHCIYVDSTFSDGRGMSIFTRPSVLKKEVSQLPIFNHQRSVVTQAERESVPFRVTPLPGKGNGALASRPISTGELIISDHAVTVISMEPTAYSRSDLDDICQSTVNLLSFQTQSRFKKLHAVGKSEPAWTRSAIDRNAFEVVYGSEETGLHFAVVPEPAVINHACRPNSVFFFDPVDLRLYVYAVRDIAVDEEITIAYRDMKQPKAARQVAIEHYGFQCTCSHCSMSEAETVTSDKRIHEIDEIMETLMDYSPTSKATLDLADKLILLYQEEQFDDRMAEPYTLATMTYNSFGEIEATKKYAAMAKSAGLLVSGSTWVELSAIEEMEKDPLTHWTHNARRGMPARV